MISSSISRPRNTTYSSVSSSSVHAVSLLRIFSLATLFLGVRSQLFPAALELSNLDGTNGFALNGIAGSDNSGFSVSSAGDVNADGVADLIIGAYGADPSGRGEAGRSYVVFGNSGLGAGGTLELSSLDGTTGFALNGIATGDQSGYSVSSAGDVNADGIADLIIGAWRVDPSGRRDAGQSYVMFGNSGLGTGGTLELSSLDSTTGFALNGIAANDRSGYSVSSAGDVNADGITDLIIGAQFADPSGRVDAGQSYVVFGKPGLGTGGTLELSSLDGTTGFALNGIAANDQSGCSVSSAGDVNADGVADLIIGARFADPRGRGGAGQSYVVFGNSGLGIGGTLELSSLDGTTGFALNGIATGDQSGFSVSSAGDVNADGVADLIIGAYGADPSGRVDAGQSYVVFGNSGLGIGGTLELSALDGTTGFVLNGLAGGDNSGYSVSSAGDVNADGITDLIIGAYIADPSGRANAGQSYVVFGKSSLGIGSTLELSSLDGTTGFALNGIAANDRNGISVSSVGDINADGVADLIIGAYGADPSSRGQAGQSYVVFGRRARSTSVSFRSTSLNGRTTSGKVQFSREAQTPSLPSEAASTRSSILPASTDEEGTPSLTLLVPTADSAGSSRFAPPHVESGTVVGTSSTPSSVLPLGIAGGVCYLVSAVATAIFVFLRTTKSKKSNDISLEETHANTQFQGNEYGELPPPRTAYGDTSFANLE